MGTSERWGVERGRGNIYVQGFELKKKMNTVSHNRVTAVLPCQMVGTKKYSMT